jgi:hypothetical protein
MSIVTCEYCSKPIDSDVDLDCFTNEGIACKACRIWDTGTHCDHDPMDDPIGEDGHCDCGAMHSEGTEESDLGVCSCCGGKI